MGEIRDMLAVGKQASRGRGDVLPPATILDPSIHVTIGGKKVKGQLVVSELGLEIQSDSGMMSMKRMLRRIPLVRWETVLRVEIDGHGFERQRGRAVFGLAAGGGVGVGRIGATHTAAQTHLVLTTAAEQLAYTLPIDPTALRNLLGKITVEADRRREQAPPP